MASPQTLPPKTPPEKGFGSLGFMLGLFIVASSFGLVTYARRSQGLIKRIADNESIRVSLRADAGRQGPLTELETAKRRVDNSELF